MHNTNHRNERQETYNRQSSNIVLETHHTARAVKLSYQRALRDEATGSSTIAAVRGEGRGSSTIAQPVTRREQDGRGDEGEGCHPEEFDI
jgi:hypothetical protein